jgi:hypothetical protein
MWRRVPRVRTDVSEGRNASVIRVTRIGELGMLEVTNNRSMLRRRRHVLLKRQILQQPNGITSQKMAFLIVPLFVNTVFRLTSFSKTDLKLSKRFFTKCFGLLGHHYVFKSLLFQGNCSPSLTIICSLFFRSCACVWFDYLFLRCWCIYNNNNKNNNIRRQQFASKERIINTLWWPTKP